MKLDKKHMSLNPSKEKELESLKIMVETVNEHLKAYREEKPVGLFKRIKRFFRRLYERRH